MKDIGKIGNPRSYLIHKLLSNGFSMDEMHKVITCIKIHEMSNRLTFEERSQYERNIAEKICDERNKDIIKDKLYELGVAYLVGDVDAMFEEVRKEYLQMSDEDKTE